MNAHNPYISVIIPVYNASKTLGLTFESLLNQDIDNIEILIVDDFSSDQSLEVIESYKPQFLAKNWNYVILWHEKNLGVANGRNTGLANAKGEYIYFLDADDYLERDALKKMYKKAKSQNLDIVGCNWFLSFKSKDRMMSQPKFSNNIDAIKLMFGGKMRWNLWLFLVKRELYSTNDIQFIPHMNMGEDMMVVVKLFFYAHNVVLLDEYLYHYNQNTDSSLTKTYSERNYEEVTHNVQEIERFIMLNSQDVFLQNSLNFLKLNIKLPLLVSNNRKNYERWNSWFVEANDYIFENKSSSFRTKFLEYSAKNKLYFLLDLYYSIVLKFVYGIIYK